MSDESERCYAAALRILNYRFNSEAELRRKLRAKKFEDDVVGDTIDRLRREKWLDDERFAAAFVRTRASKKIGKLRIRGELRAAGVRSEAIEEALRENADPEAEREALVALCAKKSRMIARRYGPEFLRTDEGRKKLASYLLNQGYDAALVLDVVKETSVAHD